jgi:hypothetical protein
MARRFFWVALAFPLLLALGCGSDDPEPRASGEVGDTTTTTSVETASTLIESCPDLPPVQQITSDADVVIFMEPDASPADLDAMNHLLSSHADVQALEFYDKPQAYEEFATLYADSPELIETVTPEILPSSFRVLLVSPDQEAVDRVGGALQDASGLREVFQFAGC